jgi:hypothetical protein
MMAIYEFETRVQALGPEPVGREAHPQVVDDALHAAVEAFDAVLREAGLVVAHKGYGVRRCETEPTPPYCYVCNDYHVDAAEMEGGQLTKPCAKSPQDVDWNTLGSGWNGGAVS